ncbi:MAG: UDP-N-acetylmuramoyl-L-alanyl-D-glutamate--2,6-diaminopimelate ligase [Acidimicrobiales bacterium]
MRLDALIDEAGLPSSGHLVATEGDLSTDVTSVTMDSRSLQRGGLFVCVPGTQRDGHDFALSAVGAGAAAVVAERHLDLGVPLVVVTSTRRCLGALASAFWGQPSEHMAVVGVTGTNGKTTTCALLASIFAAHGWSSATLGTLSGTRTTPEAPELQARLSRLRSEGVAAVAMEVSSHALDQHRVDSTRFAAAVWNNLSQDHLDYHESMGAYFAAKARLFERSFTELAVINTGDKWGSLLADRIATSGMTIETWSLDDASELELGRRGSTFSWRGQRLRLALPGRFNVDNALGAATCAMALGVPHPAVVDGLAAVTQVPGRFQAVDGGQAFTVLVDYAHTPEGLRQALEAARELCDGRLLVVFGAGGDRDPQKRPLMGEVAANLADLAVVTSDNPRHEDPYAIIEAIMAGASRRDNVVVEADRAAAIATALATAQPDDVVLIAGKGHETGQQIGDRLEPFDDVEVVRDALARIHASRRPLRSEDEQ